MTEVVWEPESINRNAKQLLESAVSISIEVNQPLVRALRSLPEMPANVRGQVESQMRAAQAKLSNSMATINAVASDLRRLTSSVEDADDLGTELPWYLRIDEIPEYYRSKPGGAYAAGLFSGLGDTATAFSALGGVVIEGVPGVGNRPAGKRRGTGRPAPSQDAARHGEMGTPRKGRVRGVGGLHDSRCRHVGT
jgi:hypothetical protein